MRLLSFSLRATIVLFKQRYVISSKHTDGTVTLMDDTGKEHTKTIDFLVDQYGRGNCRVASNDLQGSITDSTLRFVRPLSLFSEKARARADQKAQLISTLERCPAGWEDSSEAFIDLLKSTSIDLGLKRAPCLATLRTWRRQVRQSNDVRDLAPCYKDRGGRGKSRCEGEVVSLMDRYTDAIYLASEGATVKHAYDAFRGNLMQVNEFRVASAKMTIPSIDTFRRHIRRRPAYEIHAGKFGHLAAKKKFRESHYQQCLDQALSVVEVDHTILDLFVIDPGTGLPWGRPRLTVMLCRGTKNIVGYSLGFDGTRAQATLNCLRHAILPKIDLADRFPEVRQGWPAYGVPVQLLADNGPDFHSQSLKSACEDLGIGLEYSPSDRPEYKGSVERFFGTCNRDLMATLPGATLGRFWKRKNATDPASLAVIELATVHKLLHIWICDVYHQEIHRGLGSSPAAAWQARQGLIDHRLPENPDEIEMVCSATETRSLQHYGIDLHGVKTFNSKALQDIRCALEFNGSVKVRVRWNPDSMARCFVEDPRDGSWLTLHNHDAETACLSQGQWKLIRKFQRTESTPDRQLAISEARERIRQLAASMVHAKTQKGRRAAMRMLGILDGDTTEELREFQMAAPVKARRARPTSAPKAPVDSVAPWHSSTDDVPLFDTIQMPV